MLEEYLSCKLFLRKNRSLELTDQGQFLFDRLQRPFYEINQALSELRMPHGKSRINLSLRPFVSSMWFTGQLGDFWLKHPDIEINLLHRLQAPDFFRDNINFAIVWGKQGDWPQLQTLRIIPGNLTPVCAPSYLQAHGQITSPADLNQHVLIHEENQLCWEQWLRKAAGQGVPGVIEYSEVLLVVGVFFATNYNIAFASYLMAMLPTIVVYVLAQRWIMEGVTRGAIK